MSIISERSLTLTRKDFSKIYLFLSQIINEVFLENLDTSFKPANCKKIIVEIKIIYNPETDRQRHHGNVDEYPYLVEDFPSFKQQFQQDMFTVFVSSKIPKNCHKICLKSKITYET